MDRFRIKALEKMVNQEITKGGFNYRHGTTYLTPNEISGVRYASNSYGSELLSESIKLYKMIKNKMPTFQFDKEVNNSPILKIIENDRFPLLIKTNNLEIKILKTEQNEDGKHSLRQLEEIYGTRLFDIESQQLNFELSKPIKVHKLKFFKVTILREGYLPSYKLKEIIS